MRKSLQAVVCAGLLLVVFSGGVIQAQDSQFKISDYIPEKFLDFEWKVGGRFNLSGQDSETQTGHPEDYYLLNTDEWRDQCRWDGEIYTNLAYRNETVPRFLNFSLSLYGDYTRETSDGHSESPRADSEIGYAKTEFDNKSKSYLLEIGPRFDGGLYFADDFFVSLTTSALFHYRELPLEERASLSESRYIDYQSRVRTNTDIRNYETSSDDKHYTMRADLMLGRGRIYEGSHASLVMYMIEELRSNGVLLREPTHDEMLALSELVYQNSLVHVVDSRIHRIESLDDIISYLNGAGISDASGHYGQLLIGDVWDYFPSISRRFGLRARLGVGADISDYRYRYSQDANRTLIRTWYDPVIPGDVDTIDVNDTYEYRYLSHEDESRDVYLSTLLEFSEPLSRKWQLDVTGQVKYYLYSKFTAGDRDVYYRVTDWSSHFDLDTYSGVQDIDRKRDLSIDSRATYIYNSRTSVFVGGRWSYESYTADITHPDEWDPYYNNLEEDFSMAHLNFSAGITYRISIPTSVRLWASYRRSSPQTSYEDGTEWDHTNSRYYASLTLEHYLF